jgi:hypothetical protein
MPCAAKYSVPNQTMINLNDRASLPGHIRSAQIELAGRAFVAWFTGVRPKAEQIQKIKHIFLIQASQDSTNWRLTRRIEASER